MRVQLRALQSRNAARPRRADQERFSVKGRWSALQTHLQGVHGATLAIMPEEIRHHAALLSRSSRAKVTCLEKEGKPKSLPVQIRTQSRCKASLNSPAQAAKPSAKSGGGGWSRR